MFGTVQEYGLGSAIGAAIGGAPVRLVREAGRVREAGVRPRARGPWPGRPGVVSSAPLRLVGEPVRACALPRVDEEEAQQRVGGRARRVLAGAAVVVVAAAVVVGLGVLADAASQSREQPPAVVSVTVSEPGTVWEVAHRFAPAAEGAELAAVVERIVTTNSLTSVQVRPGQVLRIPLH
jgi:hypothetical protein